MLPGRRDAEGRLDVILGSPPANGPKVSGIALNGIGQVYYSTVVSTNFIHGFMVDELGRLCLNFGGAITGYLEGLPRSADGRLVAQMDTVPNAKDPFVGGIRVGPTGGIYTTAVAPPVVDRPENTVMPEVTGVGDVGETLTCDTGTWTNSPTAYNYRWLQDNTPIIGANTNSYVVVEADRLNNISCLVTAVNAGGGNSAVSNAMFIGGARYYYTNGNNQFPALGQIECNPGSWIVRFNKSDLDGNNWYDLFVQLISGDKVFIGATEGVVSGTVGFSGDVVNVPLQNWVGPANGEYLVKVEKVAT